MVGTVCVGAFLGQLDASIATLVLPTLEEVFGAQVAAVEWVAIAYLVTLAALVVTFGRLADMTGRKLLYNGGFLVFVLGSALCGLSPDLGLLIAFRVLQAVGAAMLQANSVAIITAAVPRRELGRAIGIQGAAQAIGLSIGPSVGGVLISALGWQWVFYIAVPFGLAGTLLAWFVLPVTEARDHVAERFDWAGASLFTIAVVFALLVLTFGSSNGWTSTSIVLSMTIAVVTLALFLVAEARGRFPLVDFGLFRSRIFSAGIGSGLLSYSVLFGTLFILPFYLQRAEHFDPVRTGLLLTAIPLAIGVLAPISGSMADRLGSRLPTVSGMLLAAAALLLLMFDASARIGVVLALMVLFGIGLGLFTPANNSAIMGSAPPSRLGIAGGVLNMTRSLGTSLGVAATGTVLALALSSGVNGPVQSTLNVPATVLLAGFRLGLLFLAVLAMAASAISGFRGASTPSAPPQVAAEVTGV